MTRHQSNFDAHDEAMAQPEIDPAVSLATLFALRDVAKLVARLAGSPVPLFGYSDDELAHALASSSDTVLRRFDEQCALINAFMMNGLEILQSARARGRFNPAAARQLLTEFLSAEKQMLQTIGLSPQ